MSFIFRPGMEVAAQTNLKVEAEKIETKLENVEKLEPVEEVEKIDELVEQVTEKVEVPVEEKEIVVEEKVEVAEEPKNDENEELEFRLKNAQESIFTLEKQLDLKEKAISILCEYARVSKEDLAKALSENKKLSEITGKVLVTL